MNYCLIEDAWGKCKDNIINDTIKCVNSKIEHFENNKLHKHSSKSGCTDFFIHIKKCKTCYNKVKKQFKSKIIETIQELVDENKDIIVLVLLGISILLFFNLINNITK